MEKKAAEGDGDAAADLGKENGSVGQKRKSSEGNDDGGSAKKTKTSTSADGSEQESAEPSDEDG